MKKQYHILNGDALKEKFPENVQGEKIVLRECLVDGSVKGDTLEDFFVTRSEFISENYDGYTSEDYFVKIVPEIEKIISIHEYSEINLWFEDDLFCQVNFWFTINLLNHKKCKTFIVRPPKHTQFGFGGLNKTDLISIFNSRYPLVKTDQLSNLWQLYKTDDLDNLYRTAEELNSIYPFILNAVQAHIERIPKGNLQGRPIESLKQIMKELGTVEFALVFQEFSKRESIYGFGDLQVKKLYNKINNNRNCS